MSLTITILRLLSEGEAMKPSDIAARMGHDRNSICARLAQMCRKGQVSRYRRKYSASAEQISAYLLAHGITVPISEYVEPVKAPPPPPPSPDVHLPPGGRLIRFTDYEQDADPDHGVYYHRPQPGPTALQPR